MAFDKISGMPEWNDDDFMDEGEEGEGWKPNPTRDAGKEMYQQWQQVMTVLIGAPESMKTETGDEGFPAVYGEDQEAMLLGDAYQVAVKIKVLKRGYL